MQSEAQDKALLTLEHHMAKLQELRDAAAATENWAPAISAEVKRGELMGFYVARSENLNTTYIISDAPTEAEWVQEFATQH